MRKILFNVEGKLHLKIPIVVGNISIMSSKEIGTSQVDCSKLGVTWHQGQQLFASSNCNIGHLLVLDSKEFT